MEKALKSIANKCQTVIEVGRRYDQLSAYNWFKPGKNPDCTENTAIARFDVPILALKRDGNSVMALTKYSEKGGVSAETWINADLLVPSSSTLAQKDLNYYKKKICRGA